MRGALGAILISALLGACTAPARAPLARAQSACDAPDPARPEPEIALSTEPEWGARVIAIELRGLSRVPEPLARGAIGTRVGDALDPTRVAADVRALVALEVFDQVVASSERSGRGVRLAYALSELALVGHVEYRWDRPLPVGRHVPLASGELHDRARVHRAARGLEAHLIESGHLDARVSSRERRSGDRVDVCFVVEPGERRVISEIVPRGNAQVPTRDLLGLIDEHDGKANRPGAPFRPDLFGPDRLRIQALYYDRGFLEIEVGEPVVERRGQGVRILLPIREGGAYRVARVTFAGKLRATEKRYRELFGVSVGRVFSRREVSEGLERIVAHHRALGRTARVTPETELDAASHAASLRIVIEEDEP